LIAIRYGDSDGVDALLALDPTTAQGVTAGWTSVALAARYLPEKLGATLAALPPELRSKFASQSTPTGLSPIELARLTAPPEAVATLVQAGATE
jgi:hypothetical protein